MRQYFEIERNGKKYQVQMNGTVGLTMKVQMATGEPFDPQNQMHQLQLYYAAFHNSNKHMKDCPDMDDFVCGFTSAEFNEYVEWFWARWKELEGNIPVEEEKEDKEEKKG